MKVSTIPCALLGMTVALLSANAAQAQSTAPVVVEQPVEPARTVDQTTWQATGPSWSMVGSGIGIGTFALSYVPSIVVAAGSPLGADQDLYVPIVGP